MQGYKGQTLLSMPMLVFGPPDPKTLALDELLDGPPSNVAKVWGVPRWKIVAWKWRLRVQAWGLRLRAWGRGTPRS